MRTIKIKPDPTRNVEILTWVNKSTGEERIEYMTPVIVKGSDCHNLYLDEKSKFYTNGLIGWFWMAETML